MNTENHLIIEQNAALGVITLDRVSSLNALTLDMINLQKKVERHFLRKSIRYLIMLTVWAIGLREKF